MWKWVQTGIMAAAICALAAGCTTTARPVNELSAGGWFEARTDHFVVLTNTGEHRARDLIEELEAFRRVAIEAGGLDIDADPLPFHIVAVYGTGDLESLVGRNDVFGAFQQTYRGGFAVANLSARAPDGTDSLEISYTPFGPVYRVKQNNRTVGIDGVRHEYVHYLLEVDKNRRYPLWFQEGYADYLSTFKVDYSGLARVGASVSYREIAFRKDTSDFSSESFQWIPLGALLNARGYDTGHGQGDFYAQAWLMVHYMLSDEARAEKLYTFLDALGTPVLDAQPVIEGIWGESVEDISRSIRSYMRSANYRTQKFDVPLDDLPEAVVREVPPSEVKSQLSYVAFSFQPMVPDARHAAEEAIALDPANFDAYALRATFALADEDLEAAKRWIAPVLDRADASPEILVVLGHIAVREAVAMNEAKDIGWLAKWDAARDYFEKAIALRPDYPEALAPLIQIYLVYPDPLPAHVLDYAERVKALLPTNYDSDLVRGDLLVRSGRFVEALEAYNEVIAWSRTPTSIAKAREKKREIEAALAGGGSQQGTYVAP